MAFQAFVMMVSVRHIKFRTQPKQAYPPSSTVTSPNLFWKDFPTRSAKSKWSAGCGYYIGNNWEQKTMKMLNVHRSSSNNLEPTIPIIQLISASLIGPSLPEKHQHLANFTFTDWNVGFPLEMWRLEIVLMTSSVLFLSLYFIELLQRHRELHTGVNWSCDHVNNLCIFWYMTFIKSSVAVLIFLDNLLNHWSVARHAKTEAELFFPRFDFTLSTQCVAVPATIIASMSLSCGAGHAVNARERWRVKVLDENSKTPLGGVIYWLWRAHSLSWEARTLMTQLRRVDLSVCALWVRLSFAHSVLFPQQSCQTSLRLEPQPPTGN